MSGIVTSDLPTNIFSGDLSYELEQPLEKLQTMLNIRNVDIETLDERGVSQDVAFRGIESKQLQTITGLTDNNPEMKIRSNQVRDLNDKFDKELDNSNPNYIFRSDRFTHNNRDLIRRGNSAFAGERDFFTTPPPVNTQQKIFELLQEKG